MSYWDILPYATPMALFMSDDMKGHRNWQFPPQHLPAFNVTLVYSWNTQDGCWRIVSEVMWWNVFSGRYSTNDTSWRQARLVKQSPRLVSQSMFKLLDQVRHPVTQNLCTVMRTCSFGCIRAGTLRLNHLPPNGHYMGRTAQLTSRCCILYIYSTNICNEYFKHAA